MDSQVSRSFWERRRVAIAVATFGTLAIMAFIPQELAVPSITLYVGSALLVFAASSLYFVVYVVFSSLSLRIIMVHGKGFETLEGGKVGRWFIRHLQHKTVNNHAGFRRLLYEVWYHALMIFFGVAPVMIKCGIARCTLNPSISAFSALILGTTIRSYLLVYVGSDLLKTFASFFQ